MAPDPDSNEPLLGRLLHLLHSRFDLSTDQASPAEIDASLRAGVPFRGTNLWLLIFAIFIASIGLNVNSTAVIIGAMLVSPLMGPIMGIGYGAGVNDVPLIRSSFKNLALAVALSLLTSALYFRLTPLTEASSELLARTSPTIWDVLIALFGGLAGIIGGTRREKSNVIPGVAIATALMPPLCTCGFGIATGQPYVVLGAFYLFSINSVFIATATLAMVRIMALPQVGALDPAQRVRTRNYVLAVIVLTTVPSIYLAAGLVQKEMFLTRAERFITGAFPTQHGTIVISRELDADRRVIKLLLMGDPLRIEDRIRLDGELLRAGLEGASLTLLEAEQKDVDVEALKEVVAGDLQRSTLAALEEKNRRIAELERHLQGEVGRRQSLEQMGRELRVAFPGVVSVRLGLGVEGGDNADAGDLLIVGLDHDGSFTLGDQARLLEWLKVRSTRNRVHLTVQAAPP